MKKIVLIFVLMFGLSNLYAGHDKPITFDKLPAVSQQFIKKYFPNHKIALAKKEVELLGISYDVIFTNGDRVEFKKDGSWKEIKCNDFAVPDSLIPQKILSFVQKRYPNVSIMEIEIKNRYYEVSLSNKIELKFNKKFVLIDIDD